MNELQNLADSSIWKSVRNGYLQDRLNELKDVTVPIKTDLKLTPGEAMMAKMVAAQMLLDILNDIDRFADLGGEKSLDMYD